ncbi:hypothetical protein GCM10009668_41090 [Nocardioides dubius]|uniref:PknH-like extracellular domain-containing protein n=1 Tax=Nocardioides dubius TaxID=317019 RepID=A0ABN1U2Z5_9ACTN
MSDPIRDLESFATTPTVRLDAAEVRRRGDARRRRRNVGGTVAVAVAVAVIASTGAVLAAGGDDRSDPPPATTSPTPSVLEQIPADFPIAAGLEGAEVSRTAAMEGLDYCGTTPLGDLAPRDVRSAALSGGETSEIRTVYLLPDPESAAKVQQEVVDAARRCTDGDPRDSGTVAVHDGDAAWPGVSISEDFARGAASAEPSVEVVNLLAAGPALLVTSSYGSWSGDVASGVLDTRAQLATLAAAMSGLGTPSTPGTEQEDPLLLPEAPESEKVGQGTVPDLDLAQGFVDMSADGGEQLGPSAQLTGIDRTLVCGQPLLAQQPLPTGRLLASNSGPEFLELRQVIGYRDADAAKQAFTELFDTVSACTPKKAGRGGAVMASRVWQVFGSGDPDSVVFADTAAEGLGGSLYRVSRKGRALLVVMQSGEWSTDTIGGGLSDLDRSNAVVAPMLCAMTEQGC